MPKVNYYPVFPERPTNPARTDIYTGELDINVQRMRELPEHTQEYVLNHEEGHYKNHTFDEITADRYALQKMALKKPYSLSHYLESVKEVSYHNPERVQAAQHNVLQIAASQGSAKAQELLDKYYYAAADGKPTTPTTWVLVTLVIVLTILTITTKNYE